MRNHYKIVLHVAFVAVIAALSYLSNPGPEFGPYAPAVGAVAVLALDWVRRIAVPRYFPNFTDFVTIPRDVADWLYTVEGRITSGQMTRDEFDRFSGYAPPLAQFPAPVDPPAVESPPASPDLTPSDIDPFWSEADQAALDRRTAAINRAPIVPAGYLVTPDPTRPGTHQMVRSADLSGPAPADAPPPAQISAPPSLAEAHRTLNALGIYPDL